MRVFLLIILSLFITINKTFAYELILPKEKRVTVDTNYALFMGEARKNEGLMINDKKVYIAPNGAFTHSVKLKDGENRILIKSNYDYSVQVYRIFKNEKKESSEPNLNEFEPRTYKVKKDNAPLRSTPNGYGMNRIAHLFEGTNLLIDAEKGEFYRVRLTSEKFAWISKSYVEESSLDAIPKFITMNSKTFKNASEHVIEFTGKLPYTIEENFDEMVFKVYNPFLIEDAVYTVNIRNPKKYTYRTNLCNGIYYLKVSEVMIENSKTLDGLTITIDAGHGGSEKGAIGCLGDKEKDINLAVATELKNRLCLLGANVVMTRDKDEKVSLDKRVELARENCSNIFVSIHLNSIPDVEFDNQKHKGTSVYYYNKNSKKLAESIKSSVISGLGTKDDGVKTASFAVIRPTEYIGVLVELAYMINPNDSLLYTTEDFIIKSANSITDGILKFIEE